MAYLNYVFYANVPQLLFTFMDLVVITYCRLYVFCVLLSAVDQSKR